MFLSLFSPPASSLGLRIDPLFLVVLILTMILLVGVEGLLIFVLWKFRAQASRTRVYNPANERMWEIMWTLIPLGLLMVLGIYSQRLWLSLRAFPVTKESERVVQVEAGQWYWRFRLAGPDGRFGTADDLDIENELHLPLGEPVRFELTSKDVLHGFYVPDFRVQQYAVPGQTGIIMLTPIRMGAFELRCSQLCGTSHYRMRGVIVVDSREAFDLWTRSAGKSFS